MVQSAGNSVAQLDGTSTEPKASLVLRLKVCAIQSTLIVTVWCLRGPGPDLFCLSQAAESR